MSRVLFVTDIHGNRDSYRECLDAAVAHGARAVVFGGDVTPLPDRRHPDTLGLQRTWIERFMAPAFRAFRSAHPDVPVYTMLGNDDWAWNTDLFRALEAEGACRLLHGAALPFLDGLTIAGYSCVPLTPFSMKDLDRFDASGWEPSQWPKKCLVSDGGTIHAVPLEEIRSRPTIREDLEALGRLSDPARTVYVAHTPPLDTRLDVMHTRAHIGSGALREFLERVRPPLSLHGHVHESPEMTGAVCDRVGRTLCINPGASLHYLQAALFDLADPERTLRIL